MMEPERIDESTYPVKCDVILWQIGKKLKKWRIEQGLTQKGLAKMMHVSSNTVIKIERGKMTNVKAGTLIHYIVMLGNTRMVMKELFDFSEEDRAQWGMSRHDLDWAIMQAESPHAPRLSGWKEDWEED